MDEKCIEIKHICLYGIEYEFAETEYRGQVPFYGK